MNQQTPATTEKHTPSTPHPRTEEIREALDKLSAEFESITEDVASERKIVFLFSLILLGVCIGGAIGIFISFIIYR